MTSSISRTTHAGARPHNGNDPGYQAFVLLRTAFILAPITFRSPAPRPSSADPASTPG